MNNLTLLSESTLDQLELTESEILAAVQSGLVAQSRKQALSVATSVFHPVPDQEGLIAVIQGALPGQGLAAVKNVGGLPRQHRQRNGKQSGLLIAA